MNSADNNEYVAELLKQLEDLKRQKARRLQKLKKLKKPSNHQENVSKNASRHSAGNPSRILNKSQCGSVPKCSKCGLSLISRESPCIQCISGDCKENKEIKNSEIPLNVESVTTETPQNDCSGLSKSDTNKIKLSSEDKMKDVTSFNSVNEVGIEDLTVSVLGPTQSKVKAHCDEVGKLPSKQRKRCSTLEDEAEQSDHKKLKLSGETLNLRKNSVLTGKGKNEELSLGKDLKEQLWSSPQAVDESLLQNMSCFLSTSFENADEEENDNPKDPNNSATDNVSRLSSDLKIVSSDGFSKSFPDPSICKEDELISFKAEQCLEIFNVHDSDLKIPSSRSCVTEIHKTDFDTSSSKSFNNDSFINSKIKHSLDKQLFSKPNVDNHRTTEDSLRKDTLVCLPYSNNLNSNQGNIETVEALPSDSQLIKDLKASDFSPFENSNSIEKEEKMEVDVEVENTDNNQARLFETVPIFAVGKTAQSTRLLSPQTDQVKETSDLLESNKIPLHDHVSYEEDSMCIPETSALTLIVDETEGLFDDAMTADLDFDSTSLEVADTVEDLLTKSNYGSLVQFKKPTAVFKDQTSLNVLELNPEDGDVFTIPETMLLDVPDHNSKSVNDFADSKDEQSENKHTKVITHHSSKDLIQIPNVEDNVIAGCEVIEETQCDSLDQLQTIQDTVFLNTEDSLALGTYTYIPFMVNEAKRSSSTDVDDNVEEDPNAAIKFLCSLQGDIHEPVNDIKLANFNSSSYVFIQHATWIQVWRQEEHKDWIKIFSHQVDDKLTLKEMSFTKDERHLILIMLLSGEQVHCLQFLLFESEARVIKLMEHTHWMQNRCPKETVLLCGLEDLKFATARGNDCFEVFVHVFSSLDDHPKLAVVTLGSTPALLHSLCSIEKLPNALMGTSHFTLYVWHLLEARLVTSVLLQLPDQLRIEKCIWATIESGLVFFMTVCKGKDACQLLATNLATGFCQAAMSYSFMPSKDVQTFKNEKLKAVYTEPFLAVSCDQGCYLWSVSDEYCCAALSSKAHVTAINIEYNRKNKTLITVGDVSGSVNCYSLNCS